MNGCGECRKQKREKEKKLKANGLETPALDQIGGVLLLLLLVGAWDLVEGSLQ